MAQNKAKKTTTGEMKVSCLFGFDDGVLLCVLSVRVHYIIYVYGCINHRYTYNMLSTASDAVKFFTVLNAISYC